MMCFNKIPSLHWDSRDSYNFYCYYYYYYYHYKFAIGKFKEQFKVHVKMISRFLDIDFHIL